MDDIIINKAAIIERCIGRINAEYNAKDSKFIEDFARQDSVILNIERAIQACIDIGTHIIRLKKLGIPQSSRDVFQKLSENKIISENLSNKMQKMVGFRNIAVHDYQQLNMDIVKSIVENHMEDFENFKIAIIKSSKF